MSIQALNKYIKSESVYVALSRLMGAKSVCSCFGCRSSFGSICCPVGASSDLAVVITMKDSDCC